VKLDSKSDALSVELRAQVIVFFKLCYYHICMKNQNVAITWQKFALLQCRKEVFNGDVRM
jgi:hypothetical protein